MRTGKLAISRGHQLDGPGGGPRLSVIHPTECPDAPAPRPAPEAPKTVVSGEYKPVHDRLDALERLARLRDNGVLDGEEFAAEKAYILGHAADELVLHEPLIVTELARGPSLLGRLFSWKFLPVGLAAGLAFSYASQPQETLRFFNETLRLFGA